MYVSNDPLNRSDPTGMRDKPCDEECQGRVSQSRTQQAGREFTAGFAQGARDASTAGGSRPPTTAGVAGYVVGHVISGGTQSVAQGVEQGSTGLAIQSGVARLAGKGAAEVAETAVARTAEGATRQGLMSSASPNAINAGLRAPPSAGVRAADAARPTSSGLPGEALPPRVNPSGSQVGVAEPLPPPQRGTSNPLADFLEALFGSSGGGP